jgi:hypothetical protein
MKLRKSIMRMSFLLRERLRKKVLKILIIPCRGAQSSFPRESAAPEKSSRDKITTNSITYKGGKMEKK